MSGKTQPKFSIIVPHYDKSISDESFIQGMTSLKNQTFKDFEVLLYHDGPTSRRIPDINITNLKIKITEKRYNDWGHSLRDMGIRDANGEYIVHFNPDNILYDSCLEELDKLSKREIKQQPTSEILIFPVIMRGMQTNGHVLWREKSQADKKFMIFTGFPAVKFNIDCMQLVMRTRAWLGFDGWHDKSEISDGNMYPKFVQVFGARYCDNILGEHR
jgi:hypothetical protein